MLDIIFQLDYQNSFLQNEVKINMDKLDKLLGTQNYLETLRKQQYEGQSPDPCPICKNSLERHWTIMLCGHSYCLDCIQVLLEKVSILSSYFFIYENILIFLDRGSTNSMFSL